MSTDSVGQPEVEGNLATADDQGDQPRKMNLSVDVTDSGPCRKHVRVTIPRSEIEFFENQSLKDLIDGAQVPGFRPGRVPRKLVEKRFRKEVANDVRQKLLMTSLEQVAGDESLDAINEPDFDVESLIIPEEGDFSYEFDVEVRPVFDLPAYKGLAIKRTSPEVTDDAISEYLKDLQEERGKLVPHDGPAAEGDIVVATVTTTHNGQEISRANERQIRIGKVLRFRDGEIADFDKLMTGVVPGDVREAQVKVSVEASNIALRGETVQVRFDVSDVQRLRPMEFDEEFLSSAGLESIEALRERVRSILDRQMKWEQRQSTRKQVLEKITESASWELPETLVKRQVDNALRREILEMQQAGFSSEQIAARENELLQSQVSTTRQALKEHFVLSKIATEEKIEVSPDEIEMEILNMSMRYDESPRRLRARLEKQGLIENLYAQTLERKAVDIILEHAKFEDVPAPAKTADEGVVALPISLTGGAAEEVG